jgi:hypothetical protein
MMPRTKGAKNKKGVSDWVKVGLKLSPEMVAYLDERVEQGRTKSNIVDEALRHHKRWWDRTKNLKT